MKGSIKRHVAKDGTVTWRIRVDTTDAQGRRSQPQHTYRTRREAEAGLRQWLWELEHGVAMEPSRQTVGGYLDGWLDQVRHRVKPVTLASYRWHVDAYIRPALGTVPLQKLADLRDQLPVQARRFPRRRPDLLRETPVLHALPRRSCRATS